MGGRCGGGWDAGGGPLTGGYPGPENQTNDQDLYGQQIFIPLIAHICVVHRSPMFILNFFHNSTIKKGKSS